MPGSPTPMDKSDQIIKTPQPVSCVVTMSDGTSMHLRVSDVESSRKMDPARTEIFIRGNPIPAAEIVTRSVAVPHDAGGGMRALQCPVCQQFDEAHDCTSPPCAEPSPREVVQCRASHAKGRCLGVANHHGPHQTAENFRWEFEICAEPRCVRPRGHGWEHSDGSKWWSNKS